MSAQRVAHVVVALCDNVHQGIVKVPAAIGNGQDPEHNLYWGAGCGVRHWFTKKSGEWTLLKKWAKPEGHILERVVSDEKDIHPEAVEVIVHRLRKRVDGRGLLIKTYRGLGYALEAA